MKRNLRRITVITILNILHVTASNKPAEKKTLFNILLWTSSEVPFKMGTKDFIGPKCKFQNCYITKNVSYLNDVAKFDAILFDSVALHEQPDIPFPIRRSEKQRYILLSTKSSVRYPITPEYNNFFNWTWTYKLDSDIVFQQIIIKDKDGKVVGPKKEMHWLPEAEMKPISDDISHKLVHKTKTGIWIITDCDPESQSQRYIESLQQELHKYSRNIDVYRQCPSGFAPADNTPRTEAYEDLIESTYYFYMSFENALSEDFVSTQLLTALNHFAVPVVFGGANYTRFMPHGIYLDVLEKEPAKLALTMNDIINNQKSYENMFRWHKYYTYHDSRETPDANNFCAFCAALNDKERQNEAKVYKNIVKWFNERKDWNVVPVGSKPKRSAEMKDQDKNVHTTFKPKPFVAINIKYPPRPTSAPKNVEDESCTGMLSCLKSTFKGVWDSLSIKW